MALTDQLRLWVPPGSAILIVTSGADVEDDESWPSQYEVNHRNLDQGDMFALIDDQCTLTTDGDPKKLFGGQSYGGICFRHFQLARHSPINLLNAVNSSLDSNGIFLCSVVLDRPPIDSSPATRRLDYFCAIAQRCGFACQGLYPLRPDGDRKDWVIVLRKAALAPRWALSHMRDPELAGFSKLFRDSFNSEANGELWRWKYEAGRGRAIIAKRGDRLVAHYGSTLRAVSYFGQSGTALQICDVMVDPRERGVMTKKGAMFITTTTYLEIYLGLQDYAIAYGFPNRRHMLLGEKLGLYAEVARMAEVRWTPSSASPRFRTRLAALHPRDFKQADSVNRLWTRMVRDLHEAIVVIRDWDYLSYRYFSHPTNTYEVIKVTSRWTGRLLGIIVLRRENDACELVDLVAPLRRIPLLIDQARRIARRWGCQSLYCWATEHHASRFTCGGGIIAQTDISVPTSLWPEGRSADHLKDKWWLMSGDTEFR
jgi:hypothetical protein